jgi:uncharacterized protein YgbK (DUF1537 family)
MPQHMLGSPDQPVPAAPDLLVLADDLTGAADCAVAFVRRGHRAVVGLGGQAAECGGGVLAIDADSRRLPPAQAAARHVQILMACHRPGLMLFKKIDSTLRGQPVAELVATLEALRQTSPRRLALLAPAFPAHGRKLRQGRVWLHDVPLEDTSLWAADHSYNSADLPVVLRTAGLDASLLPLAALRAGAARDTIHAAIGAGRDVLVCDSDTAADLEALAVAALSFRETLLWVGSGGLADAIAGAGPGGPAVPDAAAPARPGGLLFVVGSAAKASHAAAVALAREEGIQSFALCPAMLRRRGGADWEAAGQRILWALRAEQDTLVTIAPDPGADLSRGAELADALAELLAPAARMACGLFATGGETACALLARLGVCSIEMLREVEPGVPLGITRGRMAMPVVTKAGAFGHAGTIIQARRHLRALPHGKDTG